ncbi:MAG: hypothetical protein HOP17_09260 [Acidobacteria bacterium]|nr:hypothetical protein [Acidobacteriota bacterium]
MIDIDKIVKRDADKVRTLSEFARKFLVELNGEMTHFDVEEVKFDGDHWVVAVSFLRKISEPNELQRTLGILERRIYKRITIDWKKQQVLGMSDWSPERREAV